MEMWSECAEFVMAVKSQDTVFATSTNAEDGASHGTVAGRGSRPDVTYAPVGRIC